MNKKDREINSLRRLCLFLSIEIILTIIISGGMLMNFLAIKHNSGKMPFVASYEFENNTHFSYQNNSEVKYYLFTDRINFFNMIWSIGDFTMISGVMGLFVNSILFMNSIRKNKRPKIYKGRNLDS